MDAVCALGLAAINRMAGISIIESHVAIRNGHVVWSMSRGRWTCGCGPIGNGGGGQKPIEAEDS